MAQMKTFRKVSLLNWAVYLVLALGIAGCSLVAEETPEPEADLPTQSENLKVISATGIIVPENWATLSMNSAGQVDQIFVSEGDQVEEGEVILQLVGGDPEALSDPLRTAILSAEFEVQAAESALNDLDDAAEAAWIRAQESIRITGRQVHDLQYQLEELEIPDKQVDLTPLEAFNEMRAQYQAAEADFAPYRDEPTSDSTRQDLLEVLDDAKENYDSALQRLELSTALQAASASLDISKRDEALYREGPSPEDVAAAEDRLEIAQTSLESLQSDISNLTLRTPFSGTITEILVRKGEWVSPGVPVGVLADLSNLVVETTDLNEIDMTQLTLGDIASLTFDAIPELQVPGTVVFISDSTTAGTGVYYQTRLEMAQLPEQLRWGMTVFVDITPE